MGETGRSRERENCNQNILREKNLFSIKKKKTKQYDMIHLCHSQVPKVGTSLEHRKL